MDRIILRRMPFELCMGRDAWGREKAQPVYITLEARFDVEKAAATDDVSKTLDYGKAYKSLKKRLEVPVATFTDVVTNAADSVEPAELSLIEVVLPKGTLRAQGGVHFRLEIVPLPPKHENRHKQQLSVRGIRCACIIGVNPHEREEEQIVILNLDFSKDFDVLDDYVLSEVVDRLQEIFSIPYADVVREVVKQVERSTFQTVEALATIIARTVTVDFNISNVSVEVEKPNAIAAIEAAGVRIHREKRFFTEMDFWKVKRP